MTKPYYIRPIRPTEIDKVAEMISTGYYDDIFFIWSVDNDDQRHKIVTDYYKIYLSAKGAVAHVAETPDGELIGAAVWLPHDVDAGIYDEIDKVAGEYAPQFRAVADKSHDSEPPVGAFYQLVGFVVPKELQGMGLGGALLKYHLDILDEKGIPTYLEASTPYFGRGVYGRFGYQQVGELMVFTKKAVLYPLWRSAGDVAAAIILSTAARLRDTGGGIPYNPCANPKHKHGDEHKTRLLQSAILFGGHKWLVLETRGDMSLLLSENVIELREYHDTFENVSWAETDIRRYLNTVFYNTFSPHEQAQIIETRLCNHNNPWFDVNSGADTIDKIFLLSLHEVISYFGNGQPPSPTGKYFIDDNFNTARKAVFADNLPCRWMLRTPGNLPYLVTTITNEGKIAITGDFVNRQSTDNFILGIRPALWVNIATQNLH